MVNPIEPDEGALNKEKFSKWFNQIESFGLKSERFYDDLDDVKTGKISSNILINWLEAAFEAGAEAKAKEIAEDKPAKD